MVKTLKPYIHVLRSTGQTSPEAVAFDREWQVDTAGRIHPFRLRADSRNDVHAAQYQATAPELCLGHLTALNIRHDEFIFIDVGSGKGRVLLLAARFPFRRVTGVEFAPGLVQISQDNLKKCAGRLACQHIEVLCMDAADYTFPPEKTVLFLFNPFDGVVAKQVFRNLELSFQQFPREIHIIYLHPVCRELLDRQTWLSKVSQSEFGVTYRSAV
jgi:SAM-dependent methyltransferase